MPFLICIQSNFLKSQDLIRLEPPNWWVGMKNNNLQLLAYGANISNLRPKFISDQIKVLKVNKVENPNYLFIDIEISDDVNPGIYKIDFLDNKNVVLSHDYILRERIQGSADRKGFQSSDVLYLITPDRFANANPSNDNMPGYEDTLNRADKDGRHGGDIQGIAEHLDYVKEMGFTSIWLNPILENNQPKYSYHGYAITDFYKVDERYGSNQEYIALSKKAKDMGVGMIMDMIVNHCGHKHWWMDDLPSSDWINYIDIYQKTNTSFKTNHTKATIQDPYVADTDLDGFIHGWFSDQMPDLNVMNSFLARYLIQNSIWWVETADLQGIRMDTYPYPDKEFMTQWTCEVMDEYPNFNVVGEEWHVDPAIVSFWQKGKVNSNGYTSCLPSLMDFPIQKDLVVSLNADENRWNSGWSDIYETLALDFLYPDPFNLVVFPDNHDMSRIYTQVKEDYNLFKLAISYYSTVRGIPQFYYGTEILMSNPNSDAHGEIRGDFPGGWKGDEVNAFTGKGLNDQQKEAQNFVKTILNWRKNSDAVHNGRLMHFAPAKNSIYVLFRYTNTDKVMTILSKNKEDVKLDLSYYSQMLNGNEKGKEIITNQKIDLSMGLIVPAMSSMIIDFE